MKRTKIKLANLLVGIYKFLTGRPRDRQSFDSKRNFRSVVIFSTTALGDLLLNTPAIRAVKKRYPDAVITLVSGHRTAGLVQGSPHFDHVIHWDHKARTMFGVISALRGVRPEMAVILHSKEPYDVLAAVFSGCEYVFKNVEREELNGMGRWLTAFTFHEGRHQIRSKLDLVEVLGCDVQDTTMFVPVPFAPLPKPEGKVVVGFQLGASKPIRCWPVERFVALARKILSHSPDYALVLVGDAREREIEQAFLDGLAQDERARVISYVGETTLPQLAAVVGSMDVLVTGDTGTMHLAIALRVKTVSLFVTANPEATGPYQDSHLHQVIHVSFDPQRFDAAQRERPMSVIGCDIVMEKVLVATAVPAIAASAAAQVRRAGRAAERETEGASLSYA